MHPEPLCEQAPQLQPDLTEHETTGAHASRMGDNGQEHGLEPEPDNDEGVSEPLDLNPLRAAGWIFRDGDCIAIERQSEELGSRVLAV
jgi:hypothetical protein